MADDQGRQPEWRSKRVQIARILVAFAAFLMLLAAWTAIITGALRFDLAVTPRESSPGGIGLAGGFGLAIATLGAFFGAQRFLRTRRDTAMVAGEPVNSVRIDEGGLRWRFEDRRGYLPFRSISDVSHAGSFDDPTVLVKTALASLRLPTGGCSRTSMKQTRGRYSQRASLMCVSRRWRWSKKFKTTNPSPTRRAPPAHHADLPRRQTRRGRLAKRAGRAPLSSGSVPA